LDQKGHEQERGFYLQGWNGDAPYLAGRIIRGQVYAPAVCISMLGGIQPHRLRLYLTDPRHGGADDDGFAQRFQFAVCADMPEYQRTDRAPDRGALEDYRRIIRALLAINVENPPRFRFAPDAQQLFDDWHEDLQHRVRKGSLHPVIESHLAKYAS